MGLLRPWRGGYGQAPRPAYPDKESAEMQSESVYVRALTLDDAVAFRALRLQAISGSPTAVWPGFVTFGIEPRALQVGKKFYDEAHMVLRLDG
jgi:hypothetical protein